MPNLSHFGVRSGKLYIPLYHFCIEEQWKETPCTIPVGPQRQEQESSSVLSVWTLTSALPDKQRAGRSSLRRPPRGSVCPVPAAGPPCGTGSPTRTVRAACSGGSQSPRPLEPSRVPLGSEPRAGFSVFQDGSCSPHPQPSVTLAQPRQSGFPNPRRPF